MDVRNLPPHLLARAAEREDMTEDELYEKHAHGWTCFHCGDTFLNVRDAEEHFGFTQASEPGCRVKAGAEKGLLKALREAERDAAEAWAMILSESADAVKAMRQQAHRHWQQIRIAEEAGYERGLRDGMALPPEERP